MHQLAKATCQTIANLSQRARLGQMTKQHRRKLTPAGEALSAMIASVLEDNSVENITGNMLKQLTKKAGITYHQIALLGLAGMVVFLYAIFPYLRRASSISTARQKNYLGQ